MLQYLQSPYFGRKLKLEQHLIAKRCFVLVALAASRRASEIHAFSCKHPHLLTKSDGSIELRPRPGFIAKNQSMTFTPPPITLVPMPSDTPSHTCPVKQLLYYLKYTTKLCKQLGVQRPPELWLTSAGTPAPSRELNRWFKSMVIESHKFYAVDPGHVRFHEIRHVVSSLLATHDIPIAEVLQAIGWKSSSFSRYYARQGLTARIPVAVGGKLLLPYRQ